MLKPTLRLYSATFALLGAGLWPHAVLAQPNCDHRNGMVDIEHCPELVHELRLQEQLDHPFCDVAHAAECAQWRLAVTERRMNHHLAVLRGRVMWNMASIAPAEQLNNAQQAWLHYRDEQCGMVAANEIGDEDWKAMSADLCKIDLNRQRALELARLHAELAGVPSR